MNRAPVDSLLGSPPPPLELHSKAERPPETKPRASTTFNEEATSQNLFAEDLHFRPLEGGPTSSASTQQGHRRLGRRGADGPSQGPVTSRC